MISMHTGFCIASGNQWFQFTTAPHKVLILQCEIPKFLFQDRVKKYAAGNNNYPQNIYFITEPYIKLDRDYGYAALDRVLNQLMPDVLIIDPLYKVLSGHITDSYDVNKLLDNIDLAVSRYHCAVIIVTHTRKPQYTEEGLPLLHGSDEMLGSVYLSAWADSLLSIYKVGDEEEDKISIEFTDMRNTETILSPLHIKVNRDKLSFNLI